MKEKTEKKNKKKFPFWKFLAWKSSDVSSAAITLIITSYLTIYCTNFLGLSGKLVGTILLVSNIIDAATDLVAGFIVDNTHTRFGKARPYDLGIVGMCIFTLLMFSGPTEASQAVKVGWVFFMYTFIFGVFNTLRSAANTPYQIRAFDNDRELIGKVCSYSGIVTTLGAMVVSVSFPILMGRIATSAAGWRKLMAIYCIPLTVLGVCRFIFVKENPEIDARTNQAKVTLKDAVDVFKKNKYVWFYAGMIIIYNVLTTMSVSTYYFTYIVGNTDVLGLLSMISLVLLPLMLFMPILLKRFTLPKIIIGGACIGIVGYIIDFIAGANIGMLMVGAVLAGAATLPVSYLCQLLLMNLFDYNEYKGLARLESTTNQIAHGVSSQLGQGLGGFLLGVLLDIGGFVTAVDGAVVSQPQSAITMIRCMYSVVPAILLVLMIVSVHFLGKLDNEMPMIEEALKKKEENISENV